MRISDWSSDVCSSDLVQAELAEAIRTGNVTVGESSAKLNEVFPQQYAQQSVDSKSRAEVRTELAEAAANGRSEEHTSELQSLMRISYAVFCLKKNINRT